MLILIILCDFLGRACSAMLIQILQNTYGWGTNAEPPILCFLCYAFIQQAGGDPTSRADYVATFGYPGENRESGDTFYAANKDSEPEEEQANARSYNGWDILKFASQLSSSLVSLYVLS